ncbi:MAG: hypothetical protein LBU38_06405 [Propionibacteriaceae bacterium]|jgi:hypothetical protein|nr:hypothetical protein [Propionibacteriaceae bacterium]
MSISDRRQKPLLRQASVRALDPDGIAVTSVGTLLFALAWVICLVERQWLAEIGYSWVEAVTLTGFAMGLIGMGVTYRGHLRNRSKAPENMPADDHAAEEQS